MGLVCLPLLVGPPHWALAGQRVWARLTLWLARVLGGVSWEMRGIERLPQRGGLIAAKHQAAWETVVFLALLPGPCYVLKRELLRIPFYGWYARRSGMIGVDRSGGAAALRALLAAAEAAAAAGRTLVIFPEGTRVPPGRTGRLQPGVAGLYAALGTACTPVALNAGLTWGKGVFGVRPGHIVAEVLPEIPPGLSRAAFTAALSDALATATRRLEAEAGFTASAETNVEHRKHA